MSFSIVIGIMIQTWFLSMWISNTATAAMMMPIADAVTKQLTETVKKNRSSPVKINDKIRTHSGELMESDVRFRDLTQVDVQSGSRNEKQTGIVRDNQATNNVK
jgi:di/tricarboxylate transporter